MAGERAARTAQTRARIKRALIELIGEKGFDALTVSDVTRRAKINRGTFYLHFIDKYDMLEKLEDELIARLEQALLATPPEHAATAVELFPYETILGALVLAAEDFDFVRAISGRGGDPDFSPKLKHVIEDLLDQGLARTGSTLRDDPQLPRAYARELAIGHVLSIISLWLERGGTESPEQVARMVCAAKDVCPTNLVIPAGTAQPDSVARRDVR